MRFEPGQKIGDYEIVGKLGAGGLGVVYEVKHLISQRHEAMKIMLPERLGATDMVERFRREVQTLAALNHVNIAGLHNAFHYEGQIAMIMELVCGETLRQLCLRSAISISQSLDFASQILHALIYAHHLGVVHRDIKPQNIMITTEGVVKLLDFGIAIAARSTELTHSGNFLGSVSYMSPEQINGGKATPRSDIYSLGVTLYEVLTGRLPITGVTAYEIMIGHVQQMPVPPSQVDPLIPVPLSDIVMRALAKDPAQRFDCAEKFLGALGMAPTVRIHGAALALPQQPATVFQHPSNGSAQRKSPSQSALQTLPLEEITRKLAIYIGPVAKFVVKKLAGQFHDTDSIYREAAKQIASDTARAAFLGSKRQ